MKRWEYKGVSIVVRDNKFECTVERTKLIAMTMREMKLKIDNWFSRNPDYDGPMGIFTDYDGCDIPDGAD